MDYKKQIPWTPHDPSPPWWDSRKAPAPKGALQLKPSLAALTETTFLAAFPPNGTRIPYYHHQPPQDFIPHVSVASFFLLILWKIKVSIKARRAPLGQGRQQVSPPGPDFWGWQYGKLVSLHQQMKNRESQLLGNVPSKSKWNTSLFIF